MRTETAKEPGPLVKLAIDLGPLLVYLLAYWFTKHVILSTAAFMGATALAILASKLLHGRISAMLWFSGVMVLVLGGLTVWFHDPRFIQMKPTIYYLMVSAILAFGMITDRPMLKMVLGQAYPGLSDIGWAKLTRNWALFFVAMAIANEAVWRSTSMDFWLGYKLWGAMPATLLFAIANIPMLMKHGLSAEKAEADPPLPPQG
ncbi:intracellular septation protein [Sphingomonas sp. YR710]|jgi:intracellular septation protein|uniref:inner membrane-spanning protein YciB n=1 Tax=Sphingomonas sp. YR710 TaxID=1882773 RepID=UPI00087FA14C|nr:inner membrane-spanning protein YciB [Sphingomonas sp. YR710]SDC28598.1 intracellular septation protein [Sphingomonas sp. YR710]